MLLATLYFTLLAGALMWWMLRRQLAPMVAAAGMLAAHAESGQGLQPLPVGRPDEIGQLIGGFNHLLEALGQREIALQESEKRYRILVETSSAMIWSVDIEGRWTFVNQVVKSIYGYAPEEMLGRLFTDFELPSQAQKDLELFVKVKAGESARQYKTSHLRKDGTLVILNFNAVAMHDGAGNVIGASGTATDITTLVRSETAKQEPVARLRLLTEQLRVSLWTTDKQLRILTCSGTGLLVAGLQWEQVVGHTLDECYSFDRELIAKAKQVLASKEGVSMEEVGIGGHIFMCRIEPSLDAEGQLTGLMGMSFDVTEQKGYQDAMFAEKERTQVTLHSIGEGVIATDIEGRVTYLNPVAETLTGWNVAEAVGVPLLEVFQAYDEASGEIMCDPINTVIQQAKTSKSSGAVILHRRDSSILSIQDHCAPIMGRDGQVIGMVLTFQDISESQKMAAQLAFQGTHDALTKLPNRILLNDRLTQAIAQAERKHEQIALMFLDLDRFKNINDTLGHAVGDSLLQLIAQRLSACVRKMDTVCRLGGDEFVILLTVAWPGRVLDVTRKIFGVLGAVVKLVQLVKLAPQ
jgi:diguanylate cyclase (GGDEF)-like protein/PAS domain S-box-containing protein